MKHLKTLVVALGVALWLPMAAQAEERPAEPVQKPAESADQTATAGKCLEAVVNPVTGFAFCTNPRGAKVEPPPPSAFNRPCKPRAHDDDPFTVYESVTPDADAKVFPPGR